VTPVIVQIPVPVGATAVEGPETVAVKETVDPRAAVEESADTTTSGVTAVTLVVVPEVGATGR